MLRVSQNIKCCSEVADEYIAGPLGLLEEDAHGASLTAMLQGLNRFLLDRITQDYKSIPPYSTAFEQVSVYPTLTYAY